MQLGERVYLKVEENSSLSWIYKFFEVHFNSIFVLDFNKLPFGRLIQSSSHIVQFQSKGLMHVKVFILNKHETPFKVYRINIDLQSKTLCGFLILASSIMVNGIGKPHLTLEMPRYLDTLLKKGYLFNVSPNHITFVFMMFI